MGSTTDSGQTVDQEKGSTVHVNAAPATLRLPVPADDPNDPLVREAIDLLLTIN